MTDLTEILRKHKLWLQGDLDGSRANLSYVDLRGANLRGADLRGAILRGANLSYVDLRDVDLRSADLRGAILRRANLSYVDLRDVDLRSAILRGAILRGAILRDADLRDADLRDTNLLVYQTDIWTCYIQVDAIRIGCQCHSVDSWMKMSDYEIAKMDSRALVWWTMHKPAIMAIHNTLTQGRKENV